MAKGKNVEVVSKEIKQYSLGDHIKPSWSQTKDLFDDFSQKILDIDSRFEIHPVGSHIGFKLGNKNVFNVSPGKSRIRIDLLRTKLEDVKDPEKRVKYLENSFKFWNQHVSTFSINNTDDIDYAVMLIKQVYKQFTE